jgi:hypothetical protein
LIPIEIIEEFVFEMSSLRYPLKGYLRVLGPVRLGSRPGPAPRPEPDPDFRDPEIIVIYTQS